MTEGGDEFRGESERRGRTREWEEAERPRVERESGDERVRSRWGLYGKWGKKGKSWGRE